VFSEGQQLNDACQGCDTMGKISMSKSETAAIYTIRRNAQGHAVAIERNGYTVLLLAIGAERNEQEVERVVEVLNG
jgi:hypothetical protein